MSMFQVAKYAGVSTATVSRVLNCVPVVSESTVQNVRAAIEAVKYDPNGIRRGPRPGSRRPPQQLGTIAVMSVGMPRGQAPLAVSDGVIQAVTRCAKTKGVRVLLDEMLDLNEVSEILHRREVDGVVAFLADDAPLGVLEAMGRQLPLVWAMGGQAGPLTVDHVSENNIAIGYLAHHYLYSHGCRDMAFISILPHKRNAQQRGYAMAAAAAGAKHRCKSFIVCDDPHLPGLFGADTVARTELPELVRAFAELSPRPTGIFVDRDVTTSRVQALLIRYGIQPGRDVRIVSCDNDDSILSALYPRPASIDVGIAELGYRIVSTLLSRIQSPGMPPVFVQTMPRLCPGEDDEALVPQA
jgi:LacI family transcriptional regulator